MPQIAVQTAAAPSPVLARVEVRRREQRTGHTILLGGIGGDSHSVGLTILRQALALNGYEVFYLGTQNHLEEFFRLAPLANVVMLSSMDGHARHYLREFPELVRRFQPAQARWYLGGNLTIGDGLGDERHFLEMGFDRVFVKFVDITQVLGLLEGDLHGIEPLATTALWEQWRAAPAIGAASPRDGRLDLDTLEQTRAEVLDTWRTGRQARSLEANAEFLARQPSFGAAQAAVHAGRRPILIQPRSGVALVEEQIRLFQAFRAVGVPVLSYQVDSLTRNNNYAGAEELIRESRVTGRSLLNGFPAINHGVSALRRVVSEVGVPLQTRHSTRDPRLLAEISYAGGVTAFEGGAICYNIPYYRDYPLAEAIHAWQYVDRLTGLYHERFRIVLDREFFGTLTGTLIPPSLAIVVDLLEALLAAQQGVKCVSLGYAEQGHRPQDIAAIRTLRAMASERLAAAGYRDVQVNTVFHQYMAAFPQAPTQAEELIYQSAITAALAGATRMMVKSPVEAVKIPSLADNLQGVSLVMRGVRDAAGVAVDEGRVAEESALIRREVEAMLDAVLACGRGSLAQSVATGFARGLIDIPFAPSLYNRGEALTARDVEGAVRFLSTGRLPFDRELRAFHQHAMQARCRADGLRSHRQRYLLVERDALRIARGQYPRWPLFG
jgi:methylaspartate mutase epsilon subunit